MVDLANNLIQRASSALDVLKGVPKLAGKTRFQNLLLAEIEFLERIRSRPSSSSTIATLKSSNITHLEAVAAALLHETDPISVYRPFNGGTTSKLRVEIESGGGHRWVKVIARNTRGLRAELSSEDQDSDDESGSEPWSDENYACMEDPPPRIVRMARSYKAAAGANTINYQTPVVVFKFVRRTGADESDDDSELLETLRAQLDQEGIVVETMTYDGDWASAPLNKPILQQNQDEAGATYQVGISSSAVLLDTTACIGLVSGISFLRNSEEGYSCNPQQRKELVDYIRPLPPNHPLRLQLEEELPSSCTSDWEPGASTLIERLRHSLIPHHKKLSLITTTYVTTKIVQIIGTIANSWERARARGLFVPWCELDENHTDAAWWKRLSVRVRDMVKARRLLSNDGNATECNWLDVVSSLTKDEDLETSERTSQCPYFVLPVLLDPRAPTTAHLPHIVVVPQLQTDKMKQLRTRSRQRGEDPSAIFEHAHKEKWAVLTANLREGKKWREKGAEIVLHSARSLVGEIRKI
ncbi:hypothetical protein M427DRAFT_150904 [Gonapodya prolifera JEL478]|uniref:DUF5614 domain-containing protein n=1 Tax=Gonapodya prolifera (strain JEL478) TaxID=1344416 RepID=A0A139AYM0_GONPJ|nr:hypothetical protein M427DRAFT_150904 [Gonapodya prolifera JEL478]|eukprot:KXS21555.1 hypothetical protein M427DRAFT_150904 [Gonapodya prolifera JEL478]